jgi:hypothetical protein
MQPNARPEEGVVFVEFLDIPSGRVGEAAQRTLDRALASSSVAEGAVVRVPQETRVLARLALHRASRAGRQMLRVSE